MKKRMVRAEKLAAYCAGRARRRRAVTPTGPPHLAQRQEAEDVVGIHKVERCA